MSRPGPPPQAGAPAPKPKPQVKLSAEDQKEQAALDKILKRVERAVPPTPYIVSAPSIDPHVHRSHQDTIAWMMGHLFHHREEHLQYRSFLYREPCQDCFVLQAGEELQPATEPKPRASTTPYMGPKKTISYSAYNKSKQTSSAITPDLFSKNDTPATAPTKANTVESNGVKEAKEHPTPPAKHEQTKSPKRPASDDIVRDKPQQQLKKDETPSQPTSKFDNSNSKAHLSPSHPSNMTPHGLPPLLSPMHETLDNPYGLPAILSPTLPSSVQVELDRLQLQRKRGDSSASVSTSASDNKAQPPSKTEVPSQKLAPASDSARVRSTSINGKPPNSVSADRAGAPEKLLVKLKYGKERSEKVANILGLPLSRSRKVPPTNEKEHQGADKDRSVKGLAKAVDRSATKTTKSRAEGIITKDKDAPKSTPGLTNTPTTMARFANTAPKLAEKRPRPDDDTPPEAKSKRQKPSNDGMTTPTRPVTPSPAKSNKSSAQRSQIYTTPLKDHKAISMLRTASAESNESTPGRSGTTPSSMKHLDVKAGPTSIPFSGKKQGDAQALAQTSQKLNHMGRTLKHQAQEILAKKGKQLSNADQKRAAVTSLECILSYMAAYGAQDMSQHLRGRPADVEGTWKTLWPLCMSYAARTKDFPHLEGLRLYLCAVICATICAQVAARSARLKAHDSPQDSSQSERAKQVTQSNENLGTLSENYMRLQKATQDVRIILPVEDIQEHYPKTWAGREMDARLAKAPEKLSAPNLSGPYFLPIQSDTTPFQVVRFGLEFLSEYCAKEKLKYLLRVNLEKPE